MCPNHAKVRARGYIQSSDELGLSLKQLEATRIVSKIGLYTCICICIIMYYIYIYIEAVRAMAARTSRLSHRSEHA